jgi:hypothetical protein
MPLWYVLPTGIPRAIVGMSDRNSSMSPSLLVTPG